jgi:hypothetical protein
MPKAKLHAPGFAEVRKHYIEEKMSEPVPKFFRESQNCGGMSFHLLKIIKICMVKFP